MTVRSDRHYIRVYHDDLQRDYPAIYADDACFATWMRLLVIADKMWPTCPEIPRSVRARPLGILVESGLVEIEGHYYRIRGHNAERQRRQDAARNAAAERWQNNGNAGSTAQPMPSTSPSTSRERAEISPPPPKVGLRTNGTNPRALGTNPRMNGASPRQRKRGGIPDSVASILARAAKAGHE